EAIEKAGQKLPRRHPVRDLEPGVTAKEIFAMLAGKDLQTIDIRWPGLGRATFTTDASIDPKKEVIIPTLDQLLAYAEEKKLDKRCSNDQWEIWEENGWLRWPVALTTCCGTSLCRRGAKENSLVKGLKTDMQIARFVPSKVNEKMRRKTKGKRRYL